LGIIGQPPPGPSLYKRGESNQHTVRTVLKDAVALETTTIFSIYYTSGDIPK